MAEGGGCSSADVEAPAKVRVVRCPKCEKLLPELAGFSVYRCGGCSATLQALAPKQDEPAAVGSSSKCEEQRERRSAREAPICLCQQEEETPSNGVVVVGAPVSSACELKGSEKEKLEANVGHPSSMADVSHLVNAPGEPCMPNESGSSRGESRVEDRGSRCYLRPSKAPVVDFCLSPVDGMVKADDDDGGRGKRLQVEGGGSGVQQQQQVQQNGAFRHHNGVIVEGMQSTPRASSSLQGVGVTPNPDEGHLNFPPRRIHGHFDGGNHIPYPNHGLPNRVENLEHDRKELLKKLDELREQLSQSCKVADASNDGVPANNVGQNLYSNGLHDQSRWFRGGLSSFSQTPASCSSFVNDRSMHLQNYVPPWHSQIEMLGCSMMPFGSRMARGGARYEPYNFCQQRGSPNLSSGQFDQDPTLPYSHGSYYHQPACSCSHFCNQQWQAPSHAPTGTLVNRGGPYHANGHGLYPLNGSLSLDSDNHNRGAVNSSVISSNPVNCQRLPFGNFNGRDCRPLAGGAPFVVCCNCSELLQVPQKHFLMGKGQYKLRCGSCSQVISVQLDKDGLLACAPQPAVGVNVQYNRVRESRNQILADSYYAGDFDASGFNSRSAEEKVALPSYPPFSVAINEMMDKEEGMKLAEAENMEGRSSSSSASRDERSPDTLIRQRDASSSRELQKPEVNSRGPGLPLREHFGYSPSSITANRSGTGSRSKRSDQEKLVCVNGSFKQNSVKDVAVATEMDLVVDEYPNPRLSEDSDEASKEDDLPRSSKGGDSFFTGLIKKSFKDFSRSNQHSENRKFKVSVNGHPIPDRVVKKAEKLAGPIQPGEYWYDYQAGFWGVLGHHCLGILPPFIEDLNYPMPRNCAGGNTGVLVNGRELHQKDLDLLASRGLPTAKDRSYTIDISGKVSDAISGKELDGLGKLAPTVEKMKHGFGMRVLKETLD